MNTIENNTNSNENIITDDFIKGLTLQCFDHAIENMMNDESKEAAAELAALYFGKDCVPGSHGFTLMQGFMWGMAEGSRIFTAADEQE